MSYIASSPSHKALDRGDPHMHLSFERMSTAPEFSGFRYQLKRSSQLLSVQDLWATSVFLVPIKHVLRSHRFISQMAIFNKMGRSLI